MKTTASNIIVIVFLAIFSFTIGYNAGYNNNDTKNYEAACLQADFIRHLMDWDFNSTGPSIGTEIENSWYEWYQDLPYGVYNTKYIKDIKDFDQYCWSY